MAALKRINREIMDASMTLEYTVLPDPEGDPLIKLVIFNGPPNTPFEAGIFYTQFSYPSEYPFKPPEVIFISKIYHPNITERGFFCKCCCDILCIDRWSPALTLKHIVENIKAMVAGLTNALQTNYSSICTLTMWRLLTKTQKSTPVELQFKR